MSAHHGMESVTLVGHEVTTLHRMLLRLGDMGTALHCLGRVQSALGRVDEVPPCRACADQLEGISGSGYIRSGLATAVAELGSEVANVVEEVENMVGVVR